MAGLIIGHTDHESVRVWIRGDRRYSRAKISVWPADGDPEKSLTKKSGKLETESDYTGIVQLDSLTSATDYRLEAEFSGRIPRWKRQRLKGRFNTFPAPNDGRESFSFLLGSCNISVVKINNLLGLAMAMAGQRATDLALRRKPEGRFRKLKLTGFWILRRVVAIQTGVLLLITGFRQSGQPLLASPFLKLSELFDNDRLEFDQGVNEPPNGATIVCKGSGAPEARGTLVRTEHRKGCWNKSHGPPAFGTLVLAKFEGNFQPNEYLEFHEQGAATNGGGKIVGTCTKTGDKAEDLTLHFEEGIFEPTPRCRICGVSSKAHGELIDTEVKTGQWRNPQESDAEGVLVVTGLNRRLYTNEKIYYLDPSRSNQERLVGRVADETPIHPSFMVHAGDQIYFDFPYANRSPREKDYRSGYRENWFEDEWAHHLLRQCPHYMAIDDHEIVNDYATDFEPRQPAESFQPLSLKQRLWQLIRKPDGRRTPEDYSRPALRAYQDYVNTRHPGTSPERLYYRFSHGDARFFVMDTRTERCLGAKAIDADPTEPRMLSDNQLEEFKGWLTDEPGRLKFVVSSVPFVAEVRRTSDEGRTHEREKSSSSLDKWSGEPFRKQREEIIDFIHEHEVRHVVFLVGDMHCCYHATMRVGHPRARTVLHELAGGPIYQLRTGHRSHFFSLHEGRTAGGCRFRSHLEQVHGGSSAVMKLQVQFDPYRFEIDWEVVRTVPKPGSGASPMAGCIMMERKD